MHFADSLSSDSNTEQSSMASDEVKIAFDGSIDVGKYGATEEDSNQWFSADLEDLYYIDRVEFIFPQGMQFILEVNVYLE